MLTNAAELGLRFFVLLDSIDAIAPPKERGRSAGDFEVAALAAFLPKVLRRTIGLLKDTGSILIVVNQV